MSSCCQAEQSCVQPAASGARPPPGAPGAVAGQAHDVRHGAVFGRQLHAAKAGLAVHAADSEAAGVELFKHSLADRRGGDARRQGAGAGRARGLVHRSNCGAACREEGGVGQARAGAPAHPAPRCQQGQHRQPPAPLTWDENGRDGCCDGLVGAQDQCGPSRGRSGDGANAGLAVAGCCCCCCCCCCGPLLRRGACRSSRGGVVSVGHWCSCARSARSGLHGYCFPPPPVSLRVPHIYSRAPPPWLLRQRRCLTCRGQARRRRGLRGGGHCRRAEHRWRRVDVWRGGGAHARKRADGSDRRARVYGRVPLALYGHMLAAGGDHEKHSAGQAGPRQGRRQSVAQAGGPPP